MLLTSHLLGEPETTIEFVFLFLCERIILGVVIPSQDSIVANEGKNERFFDPKNEIITPVDDWNPGEGNNPKIIQATLYSTVGGWNLAPPGIYETL